jgi:pimeloyl-ACP methyl ester carboxylesterase
MATFVLVHGSFTGGWYWSRVRPLLQAAGHEVWTPTLTGAGDRSHLLSRSVSLETHILDIVNVLRYEDLRDVVLVGHSYGGMVITGAADREPKRVSRLIYLDATVPKNGQNATGGLTEGTGDKLDAMASGGADDASWLLPPLPLSANGVTDPADIAWIGDRRTPHPLPTLNEPIRLKNGEPTWLPRIYIRCSRREGFFQVFGSDPLQPMFEYAVASGFKILTLDAGHDPMVTIPHQVAEALTASLAAT